MKFLFRFLFYKLYRFSIAQEKSVSLNFGFICLATGFQELHLLIFGFTHRLFFNDYYNLNPKITSVLLLILGILFNYFYFIKNKKIEKINAYFQNQKRVVWRDNLLFFGYIIFLFIIMFIQVYIIKRISKG